MRLTISNQTPDNLLCRFGGDGRDDKILLVPPSSKSIEFSPKSSCLRLFRCSQDIAAKEADAVTVDAYPVNVRLNRVYGPRARWQRISLTDDSTWVVYLNMITRNKNCLIVLPRRDTSCFLASVPDSVPLSSLMLPGTHESMAFYGWPFSQCQSLSTPLDVQLSSGIRVIDVRLSIIDGRLISYHGIYPERTPFSDILSTLYSFLTTPATSSETVVVSIKQEDSDTHRFSKLVREEIMFSPGGLQMWYLDNRIPSLGEVRGKAVMFSRFGGNGLGWDQGAIGIHPTLWPDSEKVGFTWTCQDTLVQVQDWYAIPSFLSIPEKVSLATEILIPPDSPTPTLSISFCSASSLPLAFPATIARGFGWPQWGLGFEGVNFRVGKWILDRLSSESREKFDQEDDAGPRIRGWALLDFYEDPLEQGIVPLFVECNFRGRRAGEEGWH
ncbi:PLC-like phosphodiesterase [Phlebopus sp. FC_14]|nr:PLC-like phosphodiesterase [Phlebopus sp. FC_14]